RNVTGVQTCALPIYFQAFTLVDQAPIDMAIVDLDAPQAEESWKAFRQSFPQAPAITVSLTPKEQKGPYWLAKPVNPHALRSLLSSEESRVGNESVKS